MASARPAPLSFALLPPHAPFANNGNGNSSGDSEPPSPTNYSYPHNANTSPGASPPPTPRSLSFLTPPVPPNASTPNGGTVNPFLGPQVGMQLHGQQQQQQGNPFSPPASVRSFSASGSGFFTPGDATPAGASTPAAERGSGAAYPFPSPGSTRASSLVDVHLHRDAPVPRAFSTYSIGGGGGTPPAERERGSFSRPTTGSSSLRPTSNGAGAAGGSGVSASGSGGGGSAPQTPKREAFASPPARPLTIYAAAPPPGGNARMRAVRARSTAILVLPSASASASSASNNSTSTVDGASADAAPAPAQKEKPKTPKKPKKNAHAHAPRPTLNTTLDKPWLRAGAKDPHARLAYWITYGTILMGLAAGAARIYIGWAGVLLLQGNLCPVMLEDFSTATTDSLFADGGPFFREVDASGFGNGEFEMTTASPSNSYIANNQLYLLPTLTSDVIPLASVLDGAVYNLTGCTYNITHSSGYTSSAASSDSDGGEGEGGSASANGSTSTTSTDGAPAAPFDPAAYYAACSAVSNATQGKILPPVMSARISTRRSASLKFGRVEVVAKIPTGDWLWPAIWMLPVGDTYGGWPMSGEIDIMEARGNGPSYPFQGVNYVRSSLNWGPVPFLNAVAKTFGWWTQRRGGYDEGFHTYALEWSDEFMRMYVDSRLQHMYELQLNEPFWDRGDFPATVQNGTESVVLENPWVNGTKAAPFDQAFYLIMNVAVGGTNGWFPDGPEKPWLDGSATAPRDFLEAQNQWYPTWPQDPAKRAMVIDSVKMWEKC